jgi:hypothetical protein
LVLGTVLTSGRPPADAGEETGGLGSQLNADAGNSLLRLRDGTLSFGTPSPFPTLLPVDGPRGFSYRPALGFNLFSSRF